jgi:drug/metabolite transporter (DMT)-like permease
LKITRASRASPALPSGPWTSAWLLIASCALFAVVGALVKALSDRHSAGEMVFYRSVVGLLAMAAWARWSGMSLRTTVPGLHFRRCLAGVCALMCWFWSMGGLPLATAMTLNATSSLWIALQVCTVGWLLRRRRRERRPDMVLLAAVAAGFLGVAAVLQPTIHADQWLYGLVGLTSGALAALAYLQIIDIARAGEPEERVVFYFSAFGVVMGAAMTLATGGFRMPGPMQALALLMIGVLATFAQWMMTRAFAIGRPLVNATLQYSGIAFSFLLGVAWFDDAVTPLAVGGMILIAAAGVAAAMRRAPVPDASASPIPPHPPRSPT